jgi:F0F1-type ATP synthase membrane subunit b/b'
MLSILEVFIYIGLVIFGFFQVLVPLIDGDPLFPIFSRRRKEIESELSSAKEDLDLAHLEEATREQQRLAAQVHKSPKKETTNGTSGPGINPKERHE